MDASRGPALSRLSTGGGLAPVMGDAGKWAPITALTASALACVLGGCRWLTYDKFMKLSNDSLLELYNSCITRQSAPSIWLTTLIVAIRKKGKPLNDANSYRAVGLE